MTKSESARLIAEGRALESFQHQTLGHFNVSELRIFVEILASGGRLRTYRTRYADMSMVDDMKVDAYEYLIKNREIDYARCSELTDAQLEEPLIFLLCPAGTNGGSDSHLLIDGIHRLVERKRRGREDFYFYLFPLELAPRVDDRKFRKLDWGHMEVTERGLVPKKGRKI